MASSPPWPFDEDRPSGSVWPLSQADLQAILAHLGDDSDQLLADTGADRPVVAMRVRTGVGRPGGSAQARWRQGWAVLHDLAVPRSQANLDHLVIGPGGVFVIDSKQYRGRLQFDQSGRLWHGHYRLAPALRAVSFEADQAALVLTDPDVVVVPILAVHGTPVPWARWSQTVCRW
jgi:Nuclease-related domain